MVEVCGMIAEVRVPEHLVPPAGDRLVGQGHQPLQHVADRVDPGTWPARAQ